MIEPYYQDGLVTLYNGDCREILPELSGDAVVTDPPYGVSFRENEWDDEIPEGWLDAAQNAAPIVAFTTGVQTIWYYPKPQWTVCWARPASNSHSSLGGYNHWSPVLVYGKAKFKVDLLSLHAIQHSTGHDVKHPTPKPIALMGWLVENCVPDVGGTVIDCFAGSGTTLMVAKQMGRKAIGIEISEEYCDVIVRRLGQGSLFEMGG